MGISLYRRYRPQKFSEITGQSAAIGVLTKSLERSLVGHAYLFSGPRGCGKTTAARLLAKALNCLAPAGAEPCCECKNCLAIAAGESLDVVEIDGASNNGVDEVRELKTHVTLAPFSSKYKVYIIDEVHMLSIAAFNALLKTLEEPPEHVVFILATTEAHKVPVTIRSRCQHIPFHRIGTHEIQERLIYVCSAEGIASAREALWEIARLADGALRDALSMLEQVSGLGKTEITLPDVEATLGQVTRSTMERWLSGWREADFETFAELDKMLASGASPQRFLEELFSLVRNLWLAARWKNAPAALDASEQERDYLNREAKLWDPGALESIMRFLAGLMPQTRMGLRIDVLSGLLMTKIAGRETEREISADSPAPEKIPRTAQTPAAKTLPEIPAFTAKQAPRKISEPAAGPFIPNQAEAQAYDAAPSVLKELPPYPADSWLAALEAAREKEFTLYCALLDAVPRLDEERGGALVLDMAERYCYEVLKLDRYRASLQNIIAPLRDAPEFVLLCGERLTVCGARAVQARSADSQPVQSAKKRGVEKSASHAPDAENFHGGENNISDKKEEPRAQSISRSAEIPFQGLVQEAARWLGGELVLIRGAGESAEPESDDYSGVAGDLPEEE